MCIVWLEETLEQGVRVREKPIERCVCLDSRCCLLECFMSACIFQWNHTEQAAGSIQWMFRSPCIESLFSLTHKASARAMTNVAGGGCMDDGRKLFTLATRLCWLFIKIVLVCSTLLPTRLLEKLFTFSSGHESLLCTRLAKKEIVFLFRNTLIPNSGPITETICPTIVFRM